MPIAAGGEPLVSVVTPCLDPGPRLQRCLDSVRAQTYRQVEHIVVDGGSTDGTVAVLEKAPRIQWVSEKDSGQTHALAKGFGMAQGQILTWLNADDVLAPTAAATAVAAILRQPDAGVVYGDLEILRDDKRTVFRPRPPTTITDLDLGDSIGQPGTFFTREALARVGGLDESFQLAMDFDLWLRFLDAGIKFAYSGETMATFEVHDQSKSGALGRDQFLVEEFKAYMKLGRLGPAGVALNRWVIASSQAEINGHLAAGRYAEAREAARRALHLMPVFPKSRATRLLTAITPRLARLLKRAMGQI